MIVDDDPHVIESLTVLLRESGFNVAATQDGVGAVQKVRDEAPELILLDLVLPQMPGMEICRALKDDPTTRAIPIIMLTGRRKEGDKIDGLEAGADDYVTKPFSPRELVLRIHRALGM
jgi:DNA-binding response OmpR family regulator